MKSHSAPLKSHSSPLDAFSPLEKTGAISGRYVHDLSNDASTINAALMVVQSKVAKQALTAAELTELQNAVDRLSIRLRTFGEAVRSFRVEIPRQGIAQAVAIIEAVTTTHHGWTCVNKPIKDQLVSCDQRWLQFIVNELITEISVPHGEITISIEPLTSADGAPGLSGEATRDYFLITFGYENTPEIALSEAQIQASKRAGLVAWLELIRLTRGILKFASEDSRHGIYLYLPLVEA